MDNQGPGMEGKLIAPFLNATTNVIKTMASTDSVPGKPVVKTDSKTWGHITGMIGLAGDTYQGNLLISFDRDAILGIISRMLCEEFKEINKDVIDAVGEITNMICGGAKREFGEAGIAFDMSLPMIVQGKDVTLTQISSGPVVTIPFSTDCGNFVIDAHLVKK